MSIENSIYNKDDCYDESESFLSEVPVNLLKENLITQFNYPARDNTVDVVRGFIKGYKYSLEEIEIEDDEISLQSIRDEFMGFMMMLFKERFNVGMPDFEDTNEQDQDELMHFTYRFFIINMKKNFINVITNYVGLHASELADIGNRKKDISSIAFRREIDEPYIQIIANLKDVIDHILEKIKAEFTVDMFINMTDGTIPSLETLLVSSAYDNNKLTGNFVEKYVDTVTDSLKFDIEVKVRNVLFNKYRKPDEKKGNDEYVQQEEKTDET